MIDTVVTILISVITAISGGFAGWLFGRRRQNIDDINAATDTWKNIVTSLEERIDKLLCERKEDALQIEELNKRVESLQIQVNALTVFQKKAIQYEKKIAKYEKMLKEHNIDC